MAAIWAATVLGARPRIRATSAREQPATSIAATSRWAGVSSGHASSGRSATGQLMTRTS